MCGFSREKDFRETTPRTESGCAEAIAAVTWGVTVELGQVFKVHP